MMKETGQEQRLTVLKPEDPKKKNGPKVQQPGTRWDDLLNTSALERQHTDFDSLSDEAQRRYRHSTFHGMELVQDTHRLALMNMLLHGIEGGVAYRGTPGDEGTRLPPATLILSNPPFGTKKGGGPPTRGDLTFVTSNNKTIRRRALTPR